MTVTPIESLQERLGYRFRSLDLAADALRHSSFVNEQPATILNDNERLEFIGDAVLDLAVSHLLMKNHPDHREGDLSRMRAALVNETRLAVIALDIGIGALLELGKGETQTQGRTKPSILAGALEALMAAVYLDGGFDMALNVAGRLFGPSVETIAAAARDYKSQLQEMVQTRGLAPPFYELVSHSGPDHDRIFMVRLQVLGMAAEGCGKSKKAAEQQAAAKAIELLSRQG